MWKDLKEFLFSKESSNSPMVEQETIEERAIVKKVVNGIAIVRRSKNDFWRL